MANIHVGDVGTEIVFTFRNEQNQVLDLAGAQTLTATFQRPNGTKFTRNLTAGTRKGTASYLTVLGDIDQAGRWIVQGCVKILAGQWNSDVVEFRVVGNL